MLTENNQDKSNSLNFSDISVGDLLVREGDRSIFRVKYVDSVSVDVVDQVVIKNNNEWDRDIDGLLVNDLVMNVASRITYRATGRNSERQVIGERSCSISDLSLWSKIPSSGSKSSSSLLVVAPL